MKYFNKILYATSLFLALSFVSCDKLLDVELPSNIISREDVFSDIDVARTAVNGLYAQNFFVNNIYEYMLPLYLSNIADEAYHNSVNYDPLRYNSYSPTTSYIGHLWTYPYKAILLSNDLIEQLSATSVFTEEEQKEHIGEAKYFRAYGYFVLVNLFGDVPWVKSANVLETSLQPRESKEKIISDTDGIIDDLQYAETTLAGSDNAKTRVTKAAASALLARVYLYHEEWANAEAKADEVIKTSGYELDPDLDNVFLRASKEAIFSASSSASMPSYVDRTYLCVYLLNASYFKLTDDLANSFEEGDLRKEKWLKDEKTYYHCWKYKRNSASAAGDAEDLVLLRLSEQYLIRAEARAQQGKLTEAIADVNAIRQRAGLSNLSQTLSKEEVLLAIENERRHELFLEEGHRWWDLVRTGRADAVLGAFPDKQW
ncbi:MAG: RagB/SusD family nutrient uptake outer membrane protein, partial [Prevotellaceae bacterium]|nr:RagB/SusD family nutrient uptake outer membrane protein [Prevotellaceae bacterium]